MVTRKILKSKSKRVTTHSAKVIDKRVKQHKRKMKKEAGKLWKAGLKRKPGKSSQNSPMPNLVPLKKQLIKAITNKKASRSRDATIANISQKTVALTNTSILKEDPEIREQKYLESLENQKTAGKTVKGNFMKELKNVIESADIILEVLDARDPDGCRCRDMEAEV